MGKMDIQTQRLIEQCKVVLGDDFIEDFIYEDVDFNTPSAIRNGYKTFKRNYVEKASELIDENRAIVYNPRMIRAFIKKAEKKFPKYKGEIQQIEKDEIVFPDDDKLRDFFRGAKEVKFVLRDSVEEASVKDFNSTFMGSKAEFEKLKKDLAKKNMGVKIIQKYSDGQIDFYVQAKNPRFVKKIQKDIENKYNVSLGTVAESNNLEEATKIHEKLKPGPIDARSVAGKIITGEVKLLTVQQSNPGGRQTYIYATGKPSVMGAPPDSIYIDATGKSPKGSGLAIGFRLDAVKNAIAYKDGSVKLVLK
jgi:hypothetical protein